MMYTTRAFVILFCIACLSACEQPQVPRRVSSTSEASSHEAPSGTNEDPERQSAANESPNPAIPLPELAGWVRSEPRPLPREDHGFSVAYDHRTGVSVTLYQFTRGLQVIPEDLSGGPIQDEMKWAKSGIEQAVKFGYWEAATEQKSGVVPLGNSAKLALWSRYVLVDNGVAVPSDTYVWAYENTLFKVRCTGGSENSEEETKVLSELLTALGVACRSSTE